MNKLIITLLIILGVALLAWAAWYLYASVNSSYQQQQYTTQSNPPLPQTTQNPKTSGDTTTEISADLKQTPDDSLINAQLDALDKDVKNF